MGSRALCTTVKHSLFVHDCILLLFLCCKQRPNGQRGQRTTFIELSQQSGPTFIRIILLDSISDICSVVHNVASQQEGPGFGSFSMWS